MISMVKKRIWKEIVVLLTILSVLVCSSCAAPSLEERPELYTGEYFQDTTPSEHWYYILDTFITLLPHLQSPEELGVSNMAYHIGNNVDAYPDLTYDTIETNGAVNSMRLKSIPVFYGLLKETQKYEEQMGIDNSEIAEKHGKKHAVSAKSVEDYYYMLLRHPAYLTHGSVDGAEYVDGYYVYDELINPYQEWLDKGWELYITPDPMFEDEEWSGEGTPPPVDKWGECAWPRLNCYILWYDKEGNVYNVYGELFTKVEDPSYRLTDSEVMNIRNQNAVGTIVFSSVGSVLANPGDNPLVQLNSPIERIVIGTAGENNTGAG